MHRIISLSDTPKANGATIIKVTSGATNDLTVQAGTRRVVITIPGSIGGTMNAAVRVRAGISGTASHQADVSTIVPSTNAYIDTIIPGCIDDQVIDLRFPADVSWVRCFTSATGTAPDFHIEYYSLGNSALKQSNY